MGAREEVEYASSIFPLPLPLSSFLLWPVTFFRKGRGWGSRRAALPLENKLATFIDRRSRRRFVLAIKRPVCAELLSPPPWFHPSAPLSSNNQPSLRRRAHHDEWRHVLLGLISAKQNFESSLPVIQRVRRIRAITLARGIASFAAECRFQLSVFVLFFPTFCCGTRTWKVASDLLIDVQTRGGLELWKYGFHGKQV